MKQAKRLFFRVNVSPPTLKSIFSLIGLTLFCCFTASGQQPCVANPFNDDNVVVDDGIIDGVFDLNPSCSDDPLNIQSGGEYELQLAAFTSYEFTVCSDDPAVTPQVEFWQDQLTYVENFDFDMSGDCVVYSYTTCLAEDVYLVPWSHSCGGNWTDFSLTVSCTSCSISCPNQKGSLAQFDCRSNGVQLLDPAVTGECFELADLQYRIDEDQDGDFLEHALQARGTAVDGLRPDCYNVRWYYVDGDDVDCNFESASCQLCLEDVVLSCDGGTRQFSSLSDCSSIVPISTVLDAGICEDTGEEDCFVYEISYDDNGNWVEDNLVLPALGKYQINLRVCYFNDCEDAAPAFCKEVSCFEAEVVNNSAPICMLDDRSSCNYCGTDNSTEAPMFMGCGTISDPIATDEILGECGIFIVGEEDENIFVRPDLEQDIDLNLLFDSDDDGDYIDQFEEIGIDIILPDCYPDGSGRSVGLDPINMLVDHIIKRTWTAIGENGRSTSCSEYIFVLRPRLRNIWIDDYEAECGGDGTLDVDALIAKNPRFGPYYITPNDDTISLVGNHDVCRLSAVLDDEHMLEFGCPVKEKLYRDWLIVDWCAEVGDQDHINLTQIIKTVDTTAPVWDDGACPIAAEDPADSDIGAINRPIELAIIESNTCEVEIDLTDYYPSATDLCCDIDNYSARIYCALDENFEGDGEELIYSDENAVLLPKGYCRIDVTVKDLCENESEVCSIYFHTEDRVTPVVIRPTEEYQVTLDGNGNGMFCLGQVDCIASDNCTAFEDLLFDIALMQDGVFTTECLDITCDLLNADGEIMVIFRATDECGNSNIGMKTVTIKGGEPELDCTEVEDVSIPCGTYDSNMEYGNPPTATAGSCSPNAIISYNDGPFTGACGSGTVLRTYFLEVDGIQVGITCPQVITITGPEIDFTCPTQPTPEDCDIDNFSWNDPVLNNGELLCENDVMIDARTPDVVDRTNFPTITVTRTWDITRACDSSMETCVSTVTFEDCCPSVVSSDLFQSVSNNTTFIIELDPGTSSDFSSYSYQLVRDDCTVAGQPGSFPYVTGDFSSCTNIGGPMVGAKPSWDLTGDATTTTGYFILVWETSAGFPDDECEILVYPEALLFNRNVSGRIINEESIEIVEVGVELKNSASNMLQTDENGEYLFEEIPSGENYLVLPQKEDKPLNGVTTYDLVMMSQHIIGTVKLSTPYKMIAADVNNDGEITTFDVIQLRQLILYSITDFPTNSSWRFVDAGYEFPNKENPWEETFPENYEIVNLSEDMAIDFVAVKIGDVNCSAKTNNLLESEGRIVESVSLLIEDEVLSKRETKEIKIDLPKDISTSAMQFTLGFDAEVVSIEDATSKLASVSRNNFGWNLLEEGALTFAWNAKEETNSSEFLSLKITANEDIKLSEVFTISSRYTPALSFDKDGNESNVELSFVSEDGSAFVSSNLALYQNKPNPFSESTIISFELPEASLVKLTVFDIHGKIVLNSQAAFTKGYNEIQVSKEELNTAGILYYQIDTEAGSATRKMIVIQ